MAVSRATSLRSNKIIPTEIINATGVNRELNSQTIINSKGITVKQSLILHFRNYWCALFSALNTAGTAGLQMMNLIGTSDQKTTTHIQSM